MHRHYLKEEKEIHKGDCLIISYKRVCYNYNVVLFIFYFVSVRDLKRKPWNIHRVSKIENEKYLGILN